MEAACPKERREKAAAAKRKQHVPPSLGPGVTKTQRPCQSQQKQKQDSPVYPHFTESSQRPARCPWCPPFRPQASGPLHWRLPLPGTLFPSLCSNVPTPTHTPNPLAPNCFLPLFWFLARVLPPVCLSQLAWKPVRQGTLSSLMVSKPENSAQHSGHQCWSVKCSLSRNALQALAERQLPWAENHRVRVGWDLRPPAQTPTQCRSRLAASL